MRQEKNKMYLMGVLGVLSIYSAKRKDYIEAKNKLQNNAKNFYKGRKKIIEGLKMEYFH